MFIHDTHLPQVLSAEHYISQRQLDCELDVLFRPAWHLVGSESQFPRVGSFQTCELFGLPLVVWRTEEGYRTFLNVCPHRFSRITKTTQGCEPSRLRCQYHGWEFDTNGHTRRIPDARSFRPLTQGSLGLQGFPTQKCGQLIFVCFDRAAPDLAEFLGPGYAIGSELFGRDRRLACVLDYEVAANWKCKVENSLESYHVDMVHPTTFRTAPTAEECSHELSERWTTYATTQQAATAFDRKLDRLTFRIAGLDHDPEYKHFHYYPHVMFGKMRLFSWVEMNLPISPGRMRVLGHFYCYGGETARRSARWLSRPLKRWGTRFFKKLADEDNAVLAEVQQGLSSPLQPSTGLISIREERCHHFQAYVKSMVDPATLTRNRDELWPLSLQQHRRPNYDTPMPEQQCV